MQTVQARPSPTTAAAFTGDFLYKPGLAGGQQAIGGTAAGERLRLRGTSNANLGLVELEAPIIADDNLTAADALSAFLISNLQTATKAGVYSGGTIRDACTINTGTSLFAYSTISGAPAITTTATPTFAAFALFFANPMLNAGSDASHVPLSAVILNASPVLVNAFGSARTTPTATSISAKTQIRATAASGTMTLTTLSGMEFEPQYQGHASATVAFGTVRGLWARNITIPAFGSTPGTTSLTAYLAVDVDAVTFGGNVTKRALRSALTNATNTLMIENTGGAHSNFGSGDVRFNDNAGVVLGTGQDVSLRYDGTNLTLDANQVAHSSIEVRGNRVLTQGVDNFPPASPAQLTADQNNYAIPTGNSKRQVLRMSTDAARTVTGIVATTTSDTQIITNVGSNNLVLAHQNASSTAANRLISPTGANYTLAAGQSAMLWYDPTTLRWRILYGTGA